MSSTVLLLPPDEKRLFRTMHGDDYIRNGQDSGEHPDQSEDER